MLPCPHCGYCANCNRANPPHINIYSNPGPDPEPPPRQPPGPRPMRPGWIDKTIKEINEFEGRIDDEEGAIF